MLFLSNYNAYSIISNSKLRRICIIFNIRMNLPINKFKGKNMQGCWFLCYNFKANSGHFKNLNFKKMHLYFDNFQIFFFS